MEVLLSTVRGDTFDFTVTLQDGDGLPFLPEADSELIFTVRAKASSEDVLIEKRVAAADFAEDTAAFRLEPTDTIPLLSKSYVFDIEYRSGDYIKTVVPASALALYEEVTRIDQ